ncbi:MFS transporter [Sphingomonas parva]|uniref:MFS transporter n=1 Tax=Sphingomonas parva TaxID=2555898 RepID=UPI0014309F01|nr:MFS transporter [Sphingomonas parva]
MPRHPRGVDQAIARFDEVVARYDGNASQAAAAARRRGYARTARSVGKRLAGMGAAITALIVATIAFGLIVGPIGINGLFVVAFLTLVILLLFSFWPAEPKRVAYSEDLPTRTVVRQLDSLLVRERAALPAPAARRVDEISATLPLLESRLGELDPLDPLAQDARRLMGKHLPDLLERYERVPAAYRSERDGEGLTVDERLVSSLDAARGSLDDIAAKLAESERQKFETQGRFIESRYKDSGGLDGQ